MKLNIEELMVIYNLILNEKLDRNRMTSGYYENILSDILKKVIESVRDYEKE